MTGLLRLLLGLGLASLSGGLLVLAYPPYNLWLLAWVALLPMLLAQFWLMPARLIQPVTVFGIYGMSALIVLVNFVLGQGLLGLLHKEATLLPILISRCTHAQKRIGVFQLPYEVHQDRGLVLSKALVPHHTPDAYF